MGLQRFATHAAKHRTFVVLVALLTTFAGVALLLDRPKGGVLEWLGIPFMVFGGAVYAWAAWPARSSPSDGGPMLAGRFLRWLTLGGRLVKFFPAFGVGIVIADLSYNLFVSATPAVQTEDTIVLLFAGALMAYGFVPPRFARERDFVLVFLVALNGILVAPLLIARAYYADFEQSVDLYSWVALAPETSAVLSFLGIANSVHPVAGSTAPGLTFMPQNFAVPVTVVITTACSGIYSFGIFASAFVAFVLTDYERPSRGMWLSLGLGLLTSYVANVLRMVVIVLVGYYTDTAQTDLQNMLIAHSYAGWIIFLGWIALFWTALFKFLPAARTSSAAVANPGIRDRKETRCEICSNGLSPALPAIRCDCGAYYHRVCLASQGLCPGCGNPVNSEHAAVLGIS